MAILFLLSVVAAAHAVDIYVDPVTGIDSWNGSAAAPFRTLARAQRAVRSITQNGTVATPVTVHALAGTHDLARAPLALGPEDAGAPGSRIAWTGAPGALLSGGVALDPDGFAPEGAFLAYDLTKHVTVEELGALASGGLGDCANSKAEVFLGGEPATLARYPNIEDGQWRWMNVSKACDGTEAPLRARRGAAPPTDPCLGPFETLDPRAAAWTDAPDLWLHGFWQYDWADNHIKASASSAGGTTTFSIDNSTPPLYGVAWSARFLAENVLEELDLVDEYYIDRKNGTLYLLAGADVSNVVLSLASNLVTLDAGLHDVDFEGLEIGYGTGTLLAAQGVWNVTLKSLDVGRGGAVGAGLSGTDVLVRDSTFSRLGCSGLGLAGGDRETLEHGRVRAANNSVSGYARWKRTYQPGISFAGVGIHVMDNELFDGPHEGVTGSGNECSFEGNYFHDLCYEATDSGALYVGRSWSQRGNAVRGNRFERIKPTEETALGSPNVQGVYLDDEMSGWVVANNTFVDNMQGVLVGGGRHNTIENNTFVDCPSGISFDDRGLTWQTEYCEAGGQFDLDLQSFNYTVDPWAARYPELPGIFQDKPCTPVHNSIRGNTFCNVTTNMTVYANASLDNDIGGNDGGGC